MTRVYISFSRVPPLIELYDACERVRLEACPADECTVDVRLRHQVGDVFRFDGPSVKNTDRIGGIGSPSFLQDPAQEGVDLLCLFGGGRLSRPDRPDRLVGDDDLRRLRPRDPFEPRSQLPPPHLERFPPFPLLARLPPAPAGE